MKPKSENVPAGYEYKEYLKPRRKTLAYYWTFPEHAPWPIKVARKLVNGVRRVWDWVFWGEY